MESKKRTTSERGSISKSNKRIKDIRIDNSEMKRDVRKNCPNELKVNHFDKNIKIICKGGIVKDPLDLKELLDQLKGPDIINYIKDIDNLKQLIQQESFMTMLRESLMSIENGHSVQIGEAIEKLPIETRKPIKMMISSMTVNE